MIWIRSRILIALPAFLAISFKYDFLMSLQTDLRKTIAVAMNPLYFYRQGFLKTRKIVNTS